MTSAAATATTPLPSARTILATPTVARLFATSVLARVPIAAVGIVAIMRARELTGSYATGGAAAACYGLASGISQPLLARIVDRAGQARVLLPCALLAATALVVFALLPSGAAPAAVVAPMAVAGAAMPPLGASVRTLLPGVMGCREQLRAAYALESSLIEITHVVGPLLIAGAIATRSTAAAAFACAALLVGGTAAFVATPASRSWRAERRSGDGPAARALASPGVRTLLLVVALMGLTFGAVEVGIPAAAEAAGAREATGPLLSVWALGSFAGGLLALRLRRPDGAVARLAATVAAFAAGHLLLAAAGALPVLAALLLIAGSAIAPTFAAAFALVDGLAPQGGLTEAFAWLGTGIAGGFAAGGALGGWAAEQHGGDAALLIAGLAGIAALAVVAVRRATLSGPHRV